LFYESSIIIYLSNTRLDSRLSFLHFFLQVSPHGKIFLSAWERTIMSMCLYGWVWWKKGLQFLSVVFLLLPQFNYDSSLCGSKGWASELMRFHRFCDLHSHSSWVHIFHVIFLWLTRINFFAIIHRDILRVNSTKIYTHVSHSLFFIRRFSCLETLFQTFFFLLPYDRQLSTLKRISL
jgi:hypothetical protein